MAEPRRRGSGPGQCRTGAKGMLRRAGAGAATGVQARSAVVVAGASRAGQRAAPERVPRVQHRERATPRLVIGTGAGTTDQREQSGARSRDRQAWEGVEVKRERWEEGVEGEVAARLAAEAQMPCRGARQVTT